MPCIFLSHHVGYCYLWWWWWREWEWNMGAIKRGRKKKQTMLSRWSGELHHFASGHYFKRAYCRCELEQKLAAFGGKAGSFYFS